MVHRCFGLGKMALSFSCLLIIPFLDAIRLPIVKALALTDKRSSHPFISTAIMFMSMMIGGNWVLMGLHQQETDDSMPGHLGFSARRRGELFRNERPRKSACFYICLVIAAALDSFSTLLHFILIQSFNSNGLILQSKPIQFLFTSFLSWFFLSIRHYRHHYGAIAIICAAVPLVLFPYYHSFEWSIAFILLSFITKSIKHVIESCLIHKVRSIHEVLFYEGLFGLTLSLILISIFSFVQCPAVLGHCPAGYFESLNAFFKDFSVKEAIFTFGIDVICLGGTSVSIAVVLYDYLPTHLVISDVLICLIRWVYALIKGASPIIALDISLVSIGYLLLLIGSLLFCEVLIFYECGCEQNTVVAISDRALRMLEDTLDGFD